MSVDCSASDADCDIQTSMSYPSVFLLHLDQPAVRYQGPNRAAAYAIPCLPEDHGPDNVSRMLHFASRRARPDVSESLDADALSSFKTADETVFVAYLDSSDRDLFGVFEDVARKYRDEFSFGTVADPEVAEAQGVKAPAVVCYKPVDGDMVTLKELQGVEELENWYESAFPTNTFRVLTHH